VWSRRCSQADAVYRTLQVYAVFGPQIAFALTVYGFHAHLAAEGYPLSAWLFALPNGDLIVELIRLLLTASVVGQSVYCWRLSVTGDARGRGALIAGWVVLTLRALVVSIDAAHDAIVVFAR
jgi:hypothetical protein